MKIYQLFSLSFCSLLLTNSYLLSASALPNLNTQPSFKIYELAQAQRKLRVAVLDFDYSAVNDPKWISFFSGGTGGSRGVSDILVNKLVDGGNFSVIERSRLDAVLKEQNLGASGRVDAASAAQIGKILGVDLVIIGSITQFDLQQSTSGGSFLGIGSVTKDTNAFVQLNIRVINTTTAEILAVVEGKGNATQSDTQTAILGYQGGSATSNEGKLLTAATQQAADQVIVGLDSKAQQLATAPRAISSVNSVVAATSGGQVILNKGATSGYQVGMKLSIERVTQTVKDPATGKLLRQLTQKIGLAEIVEVDESSSVAKIVAGGKFKVGDVAKPAK